MYRAPWTHNHHLHRFHSHFFLAALLAAILASISPKIKSFLWPSSDSPVCCTRTSRALMSGLRFRGFLVSKRRWVTASILYSVAYVAGTFIFLWSCSRVGTKSSSFSSLTLLRTQLSCQLKDLLSNAKASTLSQRFLDCAFFAHIGINLNRILRLCCASIDSAFSAPARRP